MNKQKAILVGTAYPFRGGLAIFNERLMQEFEAKGWDVEIYTFTLQYPSFLFPGKTQYSESEAPKSPKIVRKVNSINPFNWIKIGLELKRKKPDLLLFKYWLPFMAPCFGTIARLVKSNRHSQIVSIVDNMIAHEPKFYDRLFSNYFVGAVDRFLAMSQSVLEDIQTFAAQKPVALSPHPIFDHFGNRVQRDFACQFLNIPSEGRYVLFFGLIRDYKGLDLLLEAMCHPTIRDLGIKAIVAGEFYTDGAPYYQYVKEQGIEDLIVWKTDFVKDEDVKYYFSVADVLVQPYKHATQSGVSQIAYQFDLPMIVTNVGGLSETVPHQKAGLVVEPNSSSLIQGLRDFFTQFNSSYWDEQLKIEKKKYSWDVFVSKIISG
jgi:glycosyltransferase involved in cell wall biosynthesis